MDLINKWREEDAGMLKPNVDAALEASSGLDTAKILKAKQLSVELEQPEATVLANLDYAEQKNTAKRIEAYPRLAEWATEDTKNTAVLRDNLQAFESIARLAAAGEAYKSIELPRPEPKPMDISKVSGLVQRPDGTFVRHSDSYNAHEASKQVTGDWNPDTMSETDMRLLGNRLGPYSSTNVYLSENTLDTIALAGNDFVAAYKEGSGATAFFDGLGAFANSISTDIEAMGTSAKKAWHEGKEQLGDIEVGKSIFALDFEGANAAIERNNQARVSFEGELISPTIEESVGAGVTSIARDIELAPEKAAVTAGATALGALTGRAVGQTVRGAKIGASAGYLSMSFKNSLLLETGSTYASFKGELDENGQPIPDDVAAAASALYGLIAAGIETGADAFFLKVIGLSGLTDKAGALAGKQEAKALMLAYAKNPANKTFLAGLTEKLLKTGGLEAIEEGEQEAVQVMTEYITKEYLNASGFNFSNNMSFDEIAPRITQSMKSGFWGGAGSGGGLVTITHAADYAAGKKLQQRMENASTINAEMNGENMQSVPADLKEAALNRLGLDGNYHVAADELNELYQSGVDVVTPLGLTAEELQDLAVKGLSIALPEAKVLAMNQEQFEALRPLVRETSGGKSAAEYFQQENNLAEAVAETARVQEAAFAERTEFEGKLASLAGEVTQAVENNPNLKAQLEARGETVQAYVENYTELLRGFSERMASAGVPLGQTVDRVKIFSPTELLASWKRKSTIDGVGIMYKRFGDMSRWSEAEKASAIDEVVEEGLFSRSYAEEAVATLSSEDALNQYIIDEENRAFLNEQYQRPDWLKHIWGRLDGKSLKETWPQAYKEISRSVGQGVFRTKAKGGVAIDELADELKSLNMLPRDAGADELVEMLKGHENKNPRYGKEFLQSAEQAGTRNTTKDSQGQEFFQGYAGSMSSMADGGYLIKLFNKANLSTLLHETGHVFLAEMKLAVTSGIADKAMIEDYGKLQAWLASAEKPGELEKQYARYAKAQFGGKEFKDLGRADKELARQIIREEYFVRGFEAYLLEGKAPSTELQSAFARFAAWLKAVYRNAKKLNVELTDEVRGVFDRLLTADAKVEQAALESELVAFSPEQAKAMGVAEKDLGALNELFVKAKNSAIRIMTDDLLKRKKELTKKWEQEAQEALKGDPVYELRKEVHSKGGQIDEFGLLDLVGEDAVKRLRKTLGPGAIGWGQAPEILATKYGFNSVNDMVAALLSTPSASKAIKEHVAKRQAEYDATFKAENYLLEAPEIAEMLKAAGEYIKTALGQDKGIDIDYQAIAANHLQKLTVSQASSQLQFVGALRRAIKKERSALLKDDLKAALQANKQARLHLELIKQSAAFKKETEQNEKRAKAFLDNKSAENDAKYVAMSLGARYGLTKPVGKIARGRDANTISAWFKKADDAGYTLLISPEMLHGDSFRPWRTMKVSDYEELISALTQVRVVEKNLREIDLHGKKVATEEAVEEAVDSIHTYRKPKETTAFDSESFIAGGLKTIHAAHTKIEALCLTLDGNNPLGKVWNLIYKPINDAENKRVGLRADLTEALTPVYDLYTMKEWQKISKQKVWVPELNRAIRKSEMIAIALNVGNEGNYIRLREGHGISDEQITAVLNLLDKRDLMFVQGIWDTFSRYKQAAFDLEQRMMGIRPVEVQARPVVTKFGVLRGGYYPVMYDQSKLTIDTEDKIIASRTPAATMTKHGHLKERAKYGAGTALKLDISIIPRAFDQVLTDIAFREAVVSVAKVLRCNDFRAAIESTVGNEQYRAMVAWLRDVANENQHDRVPLENFFGWARVAATTMAMGLKLTTAIAQPFGLSQSIHMLGAKNVAQGIKAAFGNPAKTMELSSWVKSKSAFMADRLNAFDRDIFDSTRWFGQEALTPTSLLDSFTHALMLRGERFLKKNAFILTSLMQYGVDLPTWIAAYDKGLKDFSGSEAKAVDYADSVVRLSQGSGYTKDLARIQRGANAYKMFTMFYSYFSTVYNLTANVVADVNMKRDAASVLAAGNAFLLLYVIPAILSEIAAGRGPDEDDGEEPLSWAVQQVIMYPMQTVVGVRTFANVVEAEFGYKFTPAQDAPASLYNLFKEMNKLAFDEDYDADGKKLAKTALRAYGFAKGLPLQQPIISAFNIMDYFDGTAPNFEVRDLVFTRQKSRR